jgi:hypothetical protein
MTKHRYGPRAQNLWGMLKYPIPVYRHAFLNKWNYFTKPKLRAKLKDLRSKYGTGKK